MKFRSKPIVIEAFQVAAEVVIQGVDELGSPVKPTVVKVGDFLVKAGEGMVAMTAAELAERFEPVAEPPAPVKRGPGRPPGSKNKPKPKNKPRKAQAQAA